MNEKLTVKKEMKKDRVTYSRKDRVTYSREEVLEAAIEYFNGDTLAGEVWTKKYALRDEDDNIYELTPDDMHRRIASEFARIEAKHPNPISDEEIFDLIKKFKYIG